VIWKSLESGPVGGDRARVNRKTEAKSAREKTFRSGLAKDSKSEEKKGRKRYKATAVRSREIEVGEQWKTGYSHLA